LGGDALLRAFAAGYEMSGMVGQYVGRAHYERGFHGTSTVGSFGAACAAAILMGLDADTTAVALGIAGTQAGGLKAQFGTMCKPLHAGKAAENGVLAAQLAARGFTGRADLLEAPQGFGAATSPSPDEAAARATPSGGSHLRHNLFKFHSACYGTHAAIEAVATVARAHRLAAADIERIEIDVEPGAERMCNIREPHTGLEAKFSLRLNAALAVAGLDTSAPATYSDATAQRADLVALRDRVSIRFMPPGWPLMLAEARVRTRDGRELVARHDSGVPDADLARQRDRLERKFMALAVPVVGGEQAEAILRAIAALEQLEDIGTLMSMLRQPT
jgi:2-methylcitrate dehydratase PrpD